MKIDAIPAAQVQTADLTAERGRCAPRGQLPLPAPVISQQDVT